VNIEGKKFKEEKYIILIQLSKLKYTSEGMHTKELKDA
jgi:hypothetical protein